ncbi:hypothetical protein PMIN03_010530 [Paraphaeosphaeria minitans]
MSSQHLHLPSDSEIVELCRRTLPFAGAPHGNRLVKISENLVVKFGIGVRRQEAANQSYARSHADKAILYVPEVFRYFEATLTGFRMGFIVMEYVLGVNLHTLDAAEIPHLADRTMAAIRHLATIPVPPGQGPGPVGGGAAQGYLWSDYGTGRDLKTIEGIENWMNQRLDIVNYPRISLAQHQQLTLRHMDLVRRNICVLSDSSICFMDWAFAGFFPAIFEIHIFRELLFTDQAWFSQLLNLSPKPDDGDKRILQYLGIPAVVNDRFSFNDESLPSSIVSSEITPPPTLPPFPAT